jgi:hypothetical protein
VEFVPFYHKGSIAAERLVGVLRQALDRERRSAPRVVAPIASTLPGSYAVSLPGPPKL